MQPGGQETPRVLFSGFLWPTGCHNIVIYYNQSQTYDFSPLLCKCLLRLLTSVPQRMKLHIGCSNIWILRMLAHHYAVLTKYYLAEFQSKSDQWFKPSRKNWFPFIQIFPETLNLVQRVSKRSDRNDLLLLKSWTFPWELENEVHKSLRRSIWVEQLIHVSCCSASCSDVGNEKFNLNLNLN